MRQSEMTWQDWRLLLLLPEDLEGRIRVLTGGVGGRLQEVEGADPSVNEALVL